MEEKNERNQNCENTPSPRDPRYRANEASRGLFGQQHSPWLS